VRKLGSFFLVMAAAYGAGDPNSSVVPAPGRNAWSAAKVAGYRLPLAGLGHAPKMVSGARYYALPEYNLKTYPVYAPDKEPANYIEWLKQQEPRPLVDIGALKTQADWIAAGREVFYGRELPRFSGSEDNFQLIRDPKVIAAYKLQATKDGVLLGLRYVVREKGKIELGTDTCAMCHTQVRADGSVIEGAPNVHTPFGPLMADLTRRYASIGADFLEERRRKHMREDYRVPFLNPDPNLPVADLPAEEIAKLYEQNPLGVHARTNTSLLYPVKIANLIGIRDEKFFDRTGTARQRDITDLMKYCGSIADVTDALTEYAPGPEGTMHLANMGLGQGIKRTPDALLYALALYLYSLQPPPNPNLLDATARHGQQVFAAEGCARCHSTGRLTLAAGYHPPEETMRATGAMNVSVGTDSNLALKTRKGTGFYRIPQLRMLWLEAAFLHDGSIGSLEEYFNPARLKPDFRSSNWSPLTAPHAVEGHPFGLTLKPPDRTALIAYLKTL
jgi:mono/diheme cytochrome c family protein